MPGTMTIVTPDYTSPADAPDADIVVVGAQTGSTWRPISTICGGMNTAAAS